MSIAGARVERVCDVDVLMRLGRVSLLAGFALGVAVAGLADPPKKGPKPSTEQAEDAARFSDYLTGRAAQLDHDWATAGPAIRRAWESAKDDQGLRHDALLLSISGGDFAGALQIAKTVPADSTDAPLANFLQTLEEIGAGHYAAAQTRLSAEPARGLDRYLNPILIAWCEVGRGRKAEALAALGALDQVAGVEAMRQLQTAMVSDALGDKAQAAVTYDKIMDAEPPLHAIIMASQFYQRQGDLDKARKAIERIDADGNSASLRGEMLARLSDKSRVAPAPDPKTGSADALFSMSASLIAEKQNDVAPLLYTRFALYLRPDFPSAQLLLSEIDQRWGRLNDAADVLLAVNEKSELRSTAERLAMGVLDKAKDDDRALKIGQAAVKAHPADMDLLLSYADLLREKNKFPEAIAAYDTALAKIPPTSNRKGLTLYHRGIAYHLSHQWPKAEADLLAAMQFRPDDPGLLNYLAFSWADQGVNLDRARTMLERAIQLVPDDGAIVDSLGWCMYRSGDYSEAIKQLERAVTLDSNDATINDHLGDAYWRAGRQIEARSQWEKAERLSDDKTLTEQIRTKLKDGLDNVENPPRRASVN